MRKLIAAAALSLAVVPFASAQNFLSSFHSVSSYREQTAEYQTGYTTGLADLFSWVVSKEPEIQNTVNACLEGLGNGDVSILFDSVVVDCDFDQSASAPIFVQMLDTMCDTDVSNMVRLGDFDGDAGQRGEAVADCALVSTLPEGLLVELTRSGQLTVLYRKGALC